MDKNNNDKRKCKTNAFVKSKETLIVELVDGEFHTLTCVVRRKHV